MDVSKRLFVCMGVIYTLKKQPPEVFCQKVFLKISQNSQENTCARVFFLIKLQALGFIKKETLALVFSCKFCEISKNTFIYRTLLVAASVFSINFIYLSSYLDWS